MRRASLRGFLQSDLRLVIIYALILLVIGVFFLFKHSGLSGDSIYYVDTARNIALGNGFIYHVASYLAYPLARPLDIAMPLYPTLVSLFIKMGLDATLSARLIPLIFLTLIPFPMYYLTRNLYGRAIAHVATIVLVFLWALAYVGSYTWTETAFIFFILLSMLFLSRLFTSPQEPVWGGDRVTLLITGVFIGLAYLIKGNGLLLLPVAFLVIFLLLTPVRDKIKYKTGLFLLLLLGFMLVSSPWLIRNYLVFGNPLHHGLLHIIQAPTADKPLRFLLVFGTALFPLVLCLPYALKYLFDRSERKKLLFLAAFPVIMVLFFTMWDLIIHRLMTPTLPFLIIIGVKALFDIAGWMHQRLPVAKRLSYQTLVAGLVIVTVLPQMVFTASYYINHTPNFLDTDSDLARPWALEKMAAYESIDWIKTNTTQGDVILSNDFDGIYHYTGRNIVWAGGGPNQYFLGYLEPYGQLDYSGLMEAVNRLDVSYVVLFRKPIVIGFRDRITRDYDGDFVYELSNGRGIPANLEVVYDKEDAIIYAMERGT